MGIMYGSLSHSHLNQIFKNVSAGLLLDIASICGPDGRSSVEGLRLADKSFATACENGLQWEVLAHEMMVEEPEACDIIQAACNSKNSVFMMTHEMQLLASLARVCTRESAVADHVNFESIRERIRSTMPEFAADEDVIDLFRFVVDLGADGAPFLKDLRHFHEKFVDPKVLLFVIIH